MAAPEVETLTSLEGPEQELAAARSRAYALFSEGLAYPDDELREILIDGGLAQPLRECLKAISTEITDSPEGWRALQEVGDTEDLAIEFTRLFDAGASGPPCPLYGGLYQGDRMAKMEEAVRFYNHFGLTLSEEPRELPDHLTTELEFLHYLSFREAQALQSGEDPGPYQRAQRDFIKRHPGRWVPELYALLGQQHPMCFFRELVRALRDFLEHV